MHSWDVIPPTNFEHNWFGQNLQVKSEPQDMGYNMHHHQLHHTQQPNSPQSMDGNSSRAEDRHSSPPAVGTPLSYCDSSSSTSHLQQRMMQQSHMGFNPLTPPGYPGAMILPSQTTAGNTTPFRPNSGYSNTNLTPSHTPPMDTTPPKSPKFSANEETPEKELGTALKNDQTPLHQSSTPTSSTNHLHQPMMFDSGDESRSMADSAEGEPGLSDEVEQFEENELDHDDDEDIRTPKVNSHGKMKTFKCKQCDFVAITKLSFWEHTRTHIKPEKMLKCAKCPFVTEYKHHLEYHMRNHSGTKPFQCNQCNYSCVNKSMLNSHMKSHSNIYQYRCQDCNYATKYCHSLKLHLRKYAHKPAMVLNADGTPNPLPIIDVYGTRRGPKSKPTKDDDASANGQQQSAAKKMKTEGGFPQPLFDLQQQQQQGQHQQQTPQPRLTPPPPAQQPSQAPTHFSLIPNLASIFQQNPNLPLFPYLNFHHMLAAQQKAVLSQFSPSTMHGSSSSMEDNSNDNDEDEIVRRHSALDLSQPNTPSSVASSGKNKRKGRAVKLALMKGVSDDDEEQAKDSTDSEQQQPTSTRMMNMSQVFPPQSPSSSTTTPQKQTQQSMELAPAGTAAAVISRRETVSPAKEVAKQVSPKVYECKFCDISFKDAVLYTIHMGYHGYNDVYQCNMCGEKCTDRVAFFLHIASTAHA